MATVTRALVRNSDGLVENMILVEESDSTPSGYSFLDISASAGDTWNGSAVVPKAAEEVVVVVNPFQTRYSAAANDAARIAILAEMSGLTV